MSGERVVRFVENGLPYLWEIASGKVWSIGHNLLCAAECFSLYKARLAVRR